MTDKRLSIASSLIDSDPDATRQICDDLLRENPDNGHALFIVAVCFIRAERFGEAIPLLEKCANMNPERAEVWNNLGLCWQECKIPLKARRCFEKAYSLKKAPDYLGNIAATYMEDGQHEKAIEWAEKALVAKPEGIQARSTLGFAQLALGRWKEGWANYDACLGQKYRKRLDWGAPDWEGQPVKSLVLYGEQGLGDEIMYASMVPDVLERVEHLTLECDPRLESLFKRSFPTVEVRGTRRLERPWAQGRQWDAQCAVGSLGKFLRPTPESCPKKPYLVADPERRIMWRALFDSFKKPVIGLCWSGGRYSSQFAKRFIGAEGFADMIRSTDAVFVSLQYKDPREEIAESGLPIRYYSEPLHENYDDTAAMVAELDYIIGPPTTVHHLAGGLGKSSLILVNPKPLWMYCYGESLPWNQDQRFHRQHPGETWTDCINRADLSKCLSGTTRDSRLPTTSSSIPSFDTAAAL